MRYSNQANLLGSISDQIVMRRIPFVILGFIIFYTGGIILGWCALPLVRLITWNRIRGQQRCQHIVARGFSLLLWYLDLIKLYESGTLHMEELVPRKLETHSGTVLIANHPTLLDIVLIKSQLGHGTVVVKPLYYYNPLLGILSWCCGYIRSGSSIGRGAVIIREAIERVNEGQTVIIFPEGTRSDPDKLLPFKRGAFMIAEQTQAPLASVMVKCTPRVLGRAQGFRGYPNRGSVKLFIFPFWGEKPEYLVQDARLSAREWEKKYRNELKKSHGSCL